MLNKKNVIMLLLNYNKWYQLPYYEWLLLQEGSPEQVCLLVIRFLNILF